MTDQERRERGLVTCNECTRFCIARHRDKRWRRCKNYETAEPIAKPKKKKPAPGRTSGA